MPSYKRDSKGGRSLLRHFAGNLKNALLDVYPELRSQALALKEPESNTRQFFEALANRTGLDPTVSDNWQSLGREMKNIRGWRPLMRKYRGNITEALRDAYPAGLSPPQTHVATERKVSRSRSFKTNNSAVSWQHVAQSKAQE